MPKIIIQEEPTMTEEIKPMTFADKWHAEKLLKRTKKKARKQLQQKGFSKGEATKLVKQSVNRIAARPTNRGAGRGG
jgi:SOS response regulatory protein OraA/RecX